MGKPTRVLFIGIDAADKDLILQWTAAGDLPTFAALQKRAAWGSTTNPVGLFVGAVWPSFYTGLSPARHTRYCHRPLRSGTYTTSFFRPAEVRGEPFWSTICRAGKRVAVIDVPKAPLVHDLNGVQIVDWGTHDPEYPLSTWPPELAAEVAARFGRDTIGNCDADGRSPAEFEALRDALLDRVARKAALTGDLLGRGDWDCFLTVFSESHCAGHQCWHLHDPSHPRHDPSVARAVGNPIRDVYRAIDAALGRLLSDVSSDTTVVLLASHGMGPHYDGTFMLDDILQRLEGFNPLPTHPRLARGLRWGWSRLPAGLRERLRSLATRVKGQVGRREVPLGERRFFQAPNNDVYGAIRINLAGREPAGRVAPGDEYDACCAMLTRELMTFVNRETGAPLVRRVFRTSEVYHGDDMHHLPDLLVEWNRTTPVRVVESPKTGAIERLYSGCRTGDHKSEGLFFVLGPDIRPGAIGQAVSVMDFAPTLSELCGVELTGIDGESFLPLVRADRVGFALGSDARG